MNQASSSDIPGGSTPPPGYIERGLNPEAKRSPIFASLSGLSPQEKRAALNEMAAGLSGLNSQEQETVLNQAGIKSPDQKSSDRLWLIIVLSFAIVLVGTFLSLAFGVLVLRKSAADAELQILLTMFTSAVAFLAGLLTPGPTRNQANNQ